MDSEILNTVTSRDGVTIAYERSGSGPALVIVNGALSTRAAGAPAGPGTASEIAGELAALAADGRRDEAVEHFMQGSASPRR